MKRYYLSELIADPHEPGAIMPAIAESGVSFSALIPTGPDGKPVSPWALCVVESKNHSALQHDRRLTALPDFPLDGKMSAINNVTKTGFINSLRARGVDTAFIGNTDGFREVVRGLGRMLDPTFDENNFDVN